MPALSNKSDVPGVRLLPSDVCVSSQDTHKHNDGRGALRCVQTVGHPPLLSAPTEKRQIPTRLDSCGPRSHSPSDPRAGSNWPKCPARWLHAFPPSWEIPRPLLAATTRYFAITNRSLARGRLNGVVSLPHMKLDFL